MNNPNDRDYEDDEDDYSHHHSRDFNTGFGNGWELNHEYNPEDRLCDW